MPMKYRLSMFLPLQGQCQNECCIGNEIAFISFFSSETLKIVNLNVRIIKTNITCHQIRRILHDNVKNILFHNMQLFDCIKR